MLYVLYYLLFVSVSFAEPRAAWAIQPPTKGESAEQSAAISMQT